MKALFLCCSILGAIAAHAQTYRIGLVTKGKDNEYWKTVHAGVVKAERELATQGIDVQVLWAAPPTESSDSEQSKLVSDFVAQSVSGLILAPTNILALRDPVEAAAKAGIPTVVIDSGLNSPSQISFVATDNYKGGYIAARRVGNLLSGTGRVILFRFVPHAGNTDARENGFIDILQHQFPQIQIVDSSHYSGPTYEGARASANALLQAQASPPDAIFCSNDVAAVGMLQALREAHWGGGKVKLVVFDSSTQTIDGLVKGDIQGLIVQNPFLIGYAGLETLVAHLSGKTVEHEIDTGCSLVTKDNIDSPEIAALVHPPVVAYSQ